MDVYIGPNLRVLSTFDDADAHSKGSPGPLSPEPTSSLEGNASAEIASGLRRTASALAMTGGSPRRLPRDRGRFRALTFIHEPPDMILKPVERWLKRSAPRLVASPEIASRAADGLPARNDGTFRSSSPRR